MGTYWGIPARMVYLYYTSCWRYTILVGNPRYISQNTDKEFPKIRKSRRERMRVCCQWSQSLSVDGVIVHWHLHISSHFRGWSIRLILIGQKSFLNQWTSTLHSKPYGSDPSSDMAGLNLKLSLTSGCTKSMKRRKNAGNQGNKTTAVQESMRWHQGK